MNKLNKINLNKVKFDQNVGKIALVRGNHVNEKSAYELADKVNQFLQDKGCKTKLISIPEEYGEFEEWAKVGRLILENDRLRRKNLSIKRISSKEADNLAEKIGKKADDWYKKNIYNLDFYFDFHNTPLDCKEAWIPDITIYEDKKPAFTIHLFEKQCVIEIPAVYTKMPNERKMDFRRFWRRFGIKNINEFVNNDVYLEEWVDLDKTYGSGLMNDNIVEKLSKNIYLIHTQKKKKKN